MKTTGLNFIEAVQAAREGHKVRRKAWQWASMAYCYCPDRQDFRFDSHGTPYSDFGANTDCFLADDWEIVPEPPKTMTFQEALEHLQKNRGKVKRQDCGPYMQIRDNVLYTFRRGSFDSYEVRLSIDDMQATDWIAVEEANQ